MNNPSNPSSSEAANPAIPSAAQLADARLRQWHQQGEVLLTIENLRSWINTAGLVLFAPRPQIASPAPSLVEAVLGAPTATPTIEQTTETRSLLARLVAEGLAVPLNLLGAGAGTVHAGAPGDTPDFVASTAVFSYVFTLRGDKAWKQPPTTSGAFKVSPLALATHEALSRRGPLSAYALTTEVGKEVTEAAVLRALAELWTHLRVLPLAQPGGAATLWELSSARFTKQIKAGANAGQPSALSALISLYLGQAVAASEDEIESFLSPLASRSRIRDVIHALLSARQFDTVAVEGRTMLYVAGPLPAFLAPEPATVEGESANVVEEIAVEAGAATNAESEDAPRITKFIPRPRKIGTGYLAKAKPSKFGAKPFAERSFPASKAGAGERGAKHGFKAGPSGGFKSGFKPRSSGGFKPGFKPRDGSGPAPDRQRRPFSKPAASGFDKTAGFDKPWEEEKARPPRKDFAPRSDRRPGQGREQRPDRGQRQASSSPRAAGSYAPRPSDGLGLSGKPRSPKSAGFSKSKAGFAGKSFASKPYSAKPFSGKPFAGKPKEGGDRGLPGESGKRVYRKFDAPRGRPARSYSSDRPARPARAEEFEGSAGKPAGDFAPRKFAGKPGGFAGKKPFGKSSGKSGGFAGKKPFAKPGASLPGKPASTFAKFAGNKKPFGKRAPTRKFKPRKDGPA